MKTIMKVMMAILILSVPGMMASGSILQSEDHIRAKVTDTRFATPGDTVHLFYGMGKSVKDGFCVNSVVPVYRVGTYFTNRTEIGKIKITKNLEDRYVEGIVVEGRLMPNDLAMQGRSECPLKSSQPES